MFTATPGELHRESFSQASRFSELIPAQPRCIFGNGDDTESPYSGTRSKRVRWMLFSRPSFLEAADARASQGLVGPSSPKKGEEVPAQETPVLCVCRTASRHSNRAKVQSPSAQFSSPPSVSVQLVRTAHPARQWVSGFRARSGAAGDLRQAPRAPPGKGNATRARRAVDRHTRIQPMCLGIAKRAAQEMPCYERPRGPRRPGEVNSGREGVKRAYKNRQLRGLNG